jgi:hypothetical protein
MCLQYKSISTSYPRGWASFDLRKLKPAHRLIQSNISVKTFYLFLLFKRYSGHKKFIQKERPLPDYGQICALQIYSLWLTFVPSSFNFYLLVQKIQTKHKSDRRTDDKVYSNRRRNTFGRIKS